MDGEAMRGKRRGLKRLMGLALVTLLIIPSALVLQPFLGGVERTAAAESVPSTVTGELIYKDTTIEQSSDITIESGGKLILINTVLTMMCDASHTYKVTVNSGGLLKVVEGSTIQANNDNYGYSLKVNRGGTFIAEESTIEDFTSSGTDYKGLYILSDDVDLVNCTISSSDTYGVYIEGCSPRIVGCYFSTEEAIRVVGDCTPHLYDNHITGATQGIYIKDNIDEYTTDNTTTWVGLTSGLKLSNEASSYYTLDTNEDCDVALLAAGSEVVYSAADFGIWGDNGKPHYEVGAALDGDSSDDYATTTEVTALGEDKDAYFALNLHRERSIKKIEIEYNNDVTGWKVYYSNAESTPPYTSTLEGWTEITESFSQVGNTYVCTLSTPITARHILYVANNYGSGEVRPEIKRFSLYTGENLGVLLTKPLTLGEGEKWGRLYIDREISESSDIFVSVCTQEIENGRIKAIGGYENLAETEIDLSELNPVKYPSIMLRMVFLNTGTDDYPRLYGFTVVKERNVLKEVDWESESADVEASQNTEVAPGELHITTTGEYYVSTFDHLTVGDVNGQDGWAVANTDENAVSQIVSDVYKGGGKALKHSDGSTATNLKTYKDFGDGISSGAIEFWWRVEDVSDGSDSYGYYMIFKDSTAGDTNGIRLKYIGEKSTVSNSFDVNYLEYYSSGGSWERLGDYFQMNRSRWYHFRIVFSSNENSFTLYVNGEKVGDTFYAYDISTIDYVEITSAGANMVYKCYVDELHLYSGDFSMGSNYAILKNTVLREGESIRRIYVECFNLNDTLSVAFTVRDNLTNYLLDKASVVGNVAVFDTAGSDAGTIGVHVAVILDCSGKHTPQVKRLWFEYERGVRYNDIKNSDKGIKIENADGYNVRENEVIAPTEKGLWIKDGIGSIYGNSVKDGTSSCYGLYVENTGRITLDGINLVDNYHTFYCIGSIVYLKNAVVSYPEGGDTGFTANSNSVIYAVDPDYTVLPSSVDFTSEVRLAHEFYVSIAGYPVSEWSEKRYPKVVYKYYRNGQYRVEEIGYGGESAVLSEKINESGETVTVTPHYIKVDDKNQFYVAMAYSQWVSVQYGYDSDGDGIADIAEKEEGKYLYECEKLVTWDKVYEDGAMQKTEGDDRIVSVEIPVTESPSTYEFSLAIRARYYNKGEQAPAFRVELGEPTAYLQESFYVKEYYEWYQTDWFTMPSGSTVEGRIVDVNGGGEVVVDKYVLLKKGSNENPPVLSSPLISDIDEDDLLDGYERRPAGFYIEAEHYTTELGTVEDSLECSNSKYVKATGDGSIVTFSIKTDDDSNEHYDVYVRAGKITGGEPATMAVMVDSTSSQKTLDETGFKWYPFRFSLSPGTHTCSISEVSNGYPSQNLKVDRVIVVREKDVEYEMSNQISHQFVNGGEEWIVNGIEIPLWATVLNVTISYTSTSAETDTGITTNWDITDIDVWGNLTAYAGGNYLKVYNMSTGVTYDLTPPSGTVQNPSLQNNEIVFIVKDNNYIIKYADLRKDKNSINIVTLKEYTTSPQGIDIQPVIYDGIVAWKVPGENKIECYLLDSDKTITITEYYGTINERISLYEQSVAWIVSGSSYSAVKVAFIGELADKQENEGEYAGLKPHIRTIMQTNTADFYKQVSIYGTKVAVLTSDSKLYLYDLVTESSTQIDSAVTFNTDSKIILRGDYIAAKLSGGTLYIKELGMDNNVYASTPTSADVYSLYGGKLYYISTNSKQSIKCYKSGYSFKINSEEFYVSDKVVGTSMNSQVVGAEIWSPDFSEAINNYLQSERQSSSHSNEVEPFVSVPLKIKSDYAGTIVLKKILLKYDNLTDPFADDLDRDGFSDGAEVLSYYGNSMIEIEDCIDFKEWIDPDSGDGYSQQQYSFAKTFYMTSPIFYTEGIDLYTGTMKAGTEENSFYVNTASSLRYSLEGIKHPGLYGISIENNENFPDWVDENFPFRPLPPKNVYPANAEGFSGYPTGFNNRVSFNRELTEEEYNYLLEVLSSIIVVRIYGSSGEELEVVGENKEFDILASYIGRELTSPLDYYSENAENTEMTLVVDMSYSAVVNFGGAEGYNMEIVCDLDLLPDRLNPELKDTLGEKSDVPDSLGIDRFFLIRLTNMDFIRTSARGSMPISSDTDNDGLADLSEVESNLGFLWSKDADRDGIADGDEIGSYHTKGYRRDSDGDGIRDSVELSISGANLCTADSGGSWYERKLRNGDYFDFSLISNEDSDLSTSTDPLDEDTDNDGLPDGWIDGWYYLGGYYGYFYYGGPWSNYYLENKWGRGITYYDGLAQVYEGEDFDLDGAVDGTMTGWDFDGVTYEYKGSGSKETNPNVKDTDEDQIPDGYEIWYAIKEPFVDEDGNLILNPTIADAYKDLDTDSFAVINEVDGTLTDTSPPEMYAQMINVEKSELKKVTRVGIKVTGEEPKCIGIWVGTDQELLSEIDVVYSYCDVDGDWYIYDVPQGIFYNGLPDGYYFYIVVYISGALKWYYTTVEDSPTFEYCNGVWTLVNNKDMALRTYKDDFTNAGDALTNLEEYTVGTNPKNLNTDNEVDTVSDDLLNDGQEVKLPAEGTQVKVLARTSVDNGMLGFNYLWNAELTTSDYIDYDKEPFTDGSRPRYQYAEKGEDFTYLPEDSLEMRMAFELRDGSIATLVYKNNEESLIIWNRTMSLEEGVPEEDGMYHIHCQYVKFDYVTTVSESGTYDIDVNYRGRDLYFSEPCSVDTDDDGVMDGEEINWNSNSDDYSSGTREYNDLGIDTAYNVRDPDSDNDGVRDGDEIDWGVDEDGQGLDTDSDENMIDPDSDGDGLWDGWERDWSADTDTDGMENMIDPDSDNDGLCDGWADGYIWDPHEEKFILLSSTDPDPIYDPEGEVSGQFDPWEGEDGNRNGVVEATETDPYNPDTDGDGLWDGYDVVLKGVPRRGELYETGDTEFDSAMNINGYDYNRWCGRSTQPIAEQQSGTDPLDSDTDDDGLSDGTEVEGLWVIMSIRHADSTGIVYTNFAEVIKTDPTLDDYDGDNLQDGPEFWNNSLPYDYDTDDDGLSDKKEVEWGSSPTDFDTDKDYLPDGYIEGWRRRGENTWKVMSGNFDNGTRDPWEGEDRDNDGVQDSGETSPVDSDSDNDGIVDGLEYFYDLVFYILDPGLIVPNSQPQCYYYDYDGDGAFNALDSDSDEDGIPDLIEDGNHNGKLDGTISAGNSYPNYDTASEPNPYDEDSDDDGLTDGNDIVQGNEKYYFADPDGDGLIACMDPDSDGDGTDDDEDTDPLHYGDTDHDGDGLTYDMEEDLGLDDNEDDVDGDGLKDGEEVLIYNTDPSNQDTDNDGLSDYSEIQIGTNATSLSDTDGDGLSDYYEYTHINDGLDPLNRDIDDDGLSDGNPFEGVKDFNGNIRSEWLDSDNDGNYNFEDPDSDDDGLSDGEELNNEDTDEISGDTNNNRILDNDEVWYDSNPLDADVDGDGLTEYEEVYIYHTNPNRADTDGDGWVDGDEVKVYKTCPRLRDTDRDGVEDDVDIDPLVDKQVYIGINEIRMLDYVDGFQLRWLGISTYNALADFKIEIFIDGEKPIIINFPNNRKRIRPNIVFEYDVDDTSDNDNSISISFEVWDRDIGYKDELCDVSGDGKACDITYSLEDDTWTGDDYVGDSNGYGHTSGEEDGSIHVDENDCELWFTISQNDYDSDGLTWWEEVHTYRTDPTEYTRNWLFMVYMDGDNNLDQAAIDDVNEMEEVGSTDLLNIVVQIDRTSGFDNPNGDWTGARRYYITQDNDPNIINSQLIQDIGEVNMGNSNTLIDFVMWATTTYNDANTYVLVLWDHGNGFYGVCLDDTSYEDRITMSELRQAMTRIRTNLGTNIDIIGFDACLMQMVEVGYQIRGTVDVIIGSEETISMDGWPYDDILRDLANNDQMSVADFATVVVNDYIASYNGGSQGNYRGATLSAFRISAIANQVTPAIDNFAQQLINGLAQWRQQIIDARANTETYDSNPPYLIITNEDSFCDIFDFAFEVNQQVDDDNIQNAAQDAMTAISNALIAEGHLANHPDSHGLTIYWPIQAGYDASYENIDFADDTQWDDFLRAIGV